ncbi:MAG: LysR family transcriptional regulator [Rhodobacteraceae bacterium]|nr:LysR family transcriptional regulator [Paracoccaceae bacterium]
MNKTPIHWDHWRSFIAVTEQGSLSGAARVLGLTQPTISRHIDLLEQATGATLFLRSQQGLALSDLGRQLLPQARAMAASAAALERNASGPIDAARGIVRLTASAVVGAQILPAVLAPLLAAHSGLEVELVLTNRNEDLLQREADLAVRMVRPVQAAIVARKIADVRIGLFAHMRYLQERGTPQTMAELAGHVLIGADRDSMALAALANAGIARRMMRFRCDDEGAQINAIRAGMGIGALQAGIARKDAGLRPVLADALSVGLECWLALHEDQRNNARVRLVADHLAQHLPAALMA